jgi:hypothetical protein
MPQERPGFKESSIWSTPIRDLGLRIAGTSLEPIIDDFMLELERLGLGRLKPRFYLSTEWGVPMDTIAIAIPFYLAHADLKEMHAQRMGHVEGLSGPDVLRYLRHEMGHVLNYAHKLYDRPEWQSLFGAITQPYIEDYRPQPFSRRYVRHLPGWYAQKHPDEDWAETFAVWMTPGHDWQRDYAGWPDALAKLRFCDRTITELREREPVQIDDELDEDVGEIGYSLAQYYENLTEEQAALPDGLDGALRGVFDDVGGAAFATEGAARLPASALVARLERTLAANVFVWTGHFPEKTLVLLRHLAQRCDALSIAYPAEAERDVTLALTTMVTALAMNHVHRGSYLP